MYKTGEDDTMKFEWEELVEDYNDGGGFITCRAKVWDGWLVKNLVWDNNHKTQSESMQFVPDEDHEWDIT